MYPGMTVYEVTIRKNYKAAVTDEERKKITNRPVINIHATIEASSVTEAIALALDTITLNRNEYEITDVVSGNRFADRRFHVGDNRFSDE